nr:retrovirus-related Pol polyprotein from transposon TNT 1-94 [Tanacetum cinerariifolium]
GFENCPPMLNKENYVTWSSRLLRYAKSRPNGKFIHNSIINGPYVRRMTPELGDTNRKTILLGLPKDVYATVDSCDTAQEIWLRVQQMMKGSDIGIQEKKAKLFNKWERFTSNDGESIESYYHRFLKLMNDLKRNKNFPEKIATRAKGNAAGHNGNQIRCYNCRGVGYFARNCIARPRRKDAAYLQTQLLIAQKEEAGIQLQAEEFDLMAAAADLDEIEKVNANCILMANLQQASTSEGQYTELLKSIPESHQVPQNDNNVISEEAVKFVGGFKFLAKEADESLAKLKALELEIEFILKAVVSQDIMSVVQNNSVGDTSNLQTELERTKERFENYVSVQKDNQSGTSTNTKFAKQSILEKPPKLGETHAFSKPVTSNSIPTPQESTIVKNDKVIAPGMFRINSFKTYREEKHVPNTVRASARTKPITVLQPSVFTKKDVNFDLNGLSSTGIDNTKTIRPQPRSNTKNDRVIQIYLWRVDSGCSKHMTGNLKLLINFVWKFLGTVRFGNDHVAAILGFGDLQWGNILITRVYFVEGVGNNLFSVGQFCDSDLEVAFRRNACFVRNLEGVDLLFGNRTTNLYTINLHDMASASPICLMARASSTKSWLWHQRLSHLIFDTINDLAKHDLVSGLPKFKYHKEHLCPSCEQEKSKRASHPPKPVPNSRQRLHLLYMDLRGPMRIDSINGKRVYNRRIEKIMETMNVSFDELSAMAFEQRTAQKTVPAAQVQQVRQTSMTSTSIADIAPTPTNSSSQAQIFQALHMILTDSIYNNNMLRNKELKLHSNPKPLLTMFQMLCSMQIRL